uniref:G_PROTEIN_RECEP_F1_2 domain-containing protein n=1 Tax=Angiostrongylus cantonensis TaxID=6313 RepID=A0A0K0D683_ANGCA
LIGYVIAFTRGTKKAKYWCGRKAAFGDFYGSFIYILNIFGYVCSFMLTTISYFKSKYRKQLTKIRYQIFLSIFSIILVSIPNGIALFVVASIYEPSTYLTCINSALGIFIYLALYDKFRHEFFQILRMLICRVKELVCHKAHSFHKFFTISFSTPTYLL